MARIVDHPLDGRGFAVGRTVALLVAEDDREMRSLLCDELWSDGYQLREAKTGEEAVEAVRQSVPALILTDLRMPGGGTQYVGRLRALAPHCPIIVMTAFGDEATKNEVLKAGATAYLNKPVRISELRATIRGLVGHHHGVPH